MGSVLLVPPSNVHCHLYCHDSESPLCSNYPKSIDPHFPCPSCHLPNVDSGLSGDARGKDGSCISYCFAYYYGLYCGYQCLFGVFICLCGMAGTDGLWDIGMLAQLVVVKIFIDNE